MLDFVGHTEEEFWQAIDRFYNRDLFEKANGQWKLKDPIWEQEKMKSLT